MERKNVHGEGKMKVIFCLTSGRSGTKYLSCIFKKNIANCVSKHEAFPKMFGKPIYWRQAGEIEKIRKVFEKKAKKIKRCKAEVYVETNHAFLKSFSDVAMEYFPDMKLIHIIRNPLEVAKSELNRFEQVRRIHFPCKYRGDDGKFYIKWALTGKEDIFKILDFDWETIYNLLDRDKVYQLLLLQWIEIENRAMEFLDKYDKHEDCFTLKFPNDLNDEKVLKQMFDFFGLKMKRKEVVTCKRKNIGAIPTVVSRKEEELLKELVPKIPDRYLEIFKKEPYVSFEWSKLLRKDN